MKEFLQQFKFWLEHLFTPHCDECDARKQCKNCEQLYMIIERERAERSKLIALLHPAQQEQEKVEIDWESINKPMSWAARREKLEQEAYKKAHQSDANQ